MRVLFCCTMTVTNKRTARRLGTCSMGIDDQAVTDEEGRVQGINNLRVVDASIIPSIPTGNLNAITIMIAEKIADSILWLTPLEPEYPPITR